MKQSGKIYSGLGEQKPSEYQYDVDNYNTNKKSGGNTINEDKKHLMQSKIFALGCTQNLQRMSRKSTYRNFFDVGFISQGAIDQVGKEDISLMLKKEANIWVENPNFIFPLNPKQKKALEEAISHKANNMGWTRDDESQELGTTLFKGNAV